MEMILWLQFSVSGLLLTLLCIIGFLGNTLTLYILNANKDMRKQSINIYLTVLALYDNGVLVNAVLMLGVPALYLSAKFADSDVSALDSQLEHNESNILFERQTNTNCSQTCDTDINMANKSAASYGHSYGHYSPLHHYIGVVYPLALFSQTGSIWTTCLITAERYLAICHPLRSLTLSTRSRAVWALAGVSVAAFVYNLPRFAEVDRKDELIGKSDLRRDKLYYWLYYICLNLSLIYMLPLSLLSVLNTKIYLAVRSASSSRTALTRHEQHELNLASMLVLLVAIFIACNAPAFIVTCLELFEPPYLFIATMVSNLLVCLNSAVNFLIYCIFGKKFRQKLKNVLKCQTKRKQTKCVSNRNFYFGASFAADTYV